MGTGAVSFAVQTQIPRCVSLSPVLMSTLQRVNISLTREKESMYSQFFQTGEVLEYICWKLSDVVHAQVTVENKTSVRNTA